MLNNSPPNILWICTDQQRFDTIRAQGNKYISTPNLDKLWRNGIAFTHAYCQSPICTPSRASFLTGTYPSSSHNTRNGNETFVNRYPLITKTLADLGYDCGLIGKLHLSSAFSRIEKRTEDGFRFWSYSHAPRDDWPEGHDYSKWIAQKGISLNEILQNPTDIPAELHQSSWCADKAIEFIKQNRKQNQPWLACVNFFDPHPPFDPPKDYLDRYNPLKLPYPSFSENDLITQTKLDKIDFQSSVRNPDNLDLKNPLIQGVTNSKKNKETIPFSTNALEIKAAYYAMIELLDKQIGRIISALEETKENHNTIVIFTSDHGEMLGDHGLIQKGCRFYEGLVRVPLIFHCPSLLSQGIVSKALVELTDIAPTILDLIGENIPKWMSGKSLLDILNGVKSPDYHKNSVYCEYLDALDALDASRATMYRKENYKLIVYHGHNIGELYDLETDPEEFYNLWEDKKYIRIKSELLIESYNTTVKAIDTGAERIGPM